MATEIHNIIAAMLPGLYCKNDDTDKIEGEVSGKKGMYTHRQIVQDIIKNGKGYLEAAKFAKPVNSAYFDFLKSVNPMSSKSDILRNPIEKHNLVYETLGGSLEPVYFWILDKIELNYKSKPYKLVDNFVAATGSTVFAEMGMRATRMQEEGMKILGAVNQVIKSILNIVYDLKDFQLRLSIYNKYHSADVAEKSSALLSLKQVWLDTVDMKRGNTSIKGLALGAQANFATLIDAFMAAENEKLEYRGEKMDLNDRVKRIIEQRLPEFFRWIDESEKELKKRFEIEKTYLKSQYNTVQLYAKWAKPYLISASKLEQRASLTSSLVESFNTNLLELTILGAREYAVMEDVTNGIFPKEYFTVKSIFSPEVKLPRKYYEVLVVEFRFRSVPEKTGQSHTFRGTADIVFTSYAMSQEEINLLRELVDKDNLGDVLEIIEGATSQSLAQFKDDIDQYLGESKEENKPEEKKEEKKSNLANENPFVALFSFTSAFKKEKKETTPVKNKGPEFKKLTPDTFIERAIRNQALMNSRKRCFDFYEEYKQINTMPTFRNPMPSLII